MTSIHDTAYPHLRTTYSSADLIRLFTPTPHERELATQVTKGGVARLGFLVLLKTVQQLGYFVPLADVPRSIVQHLAQALQFTPTPSDLQGYDRSGSRRRHVPIIRDYLQLHAYDRAAQRLVIDALQRTAATKEHLADLINVAITELVKAHCELPGFTTLVKLAQRIRSAVYRRYYALVQVRLTPEVCARIDGWFQTEATATSSSWNNLKQDAGSPTRTQLAEQLGRLTWLENQQIDPQALAGIPEAKVQHFATEARTLDAARMAEMQPAKRYTLAVALHAIEGAGTRDNLATMLIKRMQAVHKAARTALEEYRSTHAERTDTLIATLQDLVTAFRQEGSGEERLAAMSTVLGDRSEDVLAQCTEHLAYSANASYPFLWKPFRSSRAVILQILRRLTIRTTTQDTRLEAALAFLLANAHRVGDDLVVVRERKPSPGQRIFEPLLDLSWIPDGWWRFVTSTHTQRDSVRKVDRRAFMLCVLSQVVAALRNGDMYIVGSDQYANLDDQLISWETYHTQVAEYGRLVNLPIVGPDFTAHVKQQLTQTIQHVDAAFPDNTDVRFENDRLVVRRLRPRLVPAEVRDLQQIIGERARAVTILDVLDDTSRWISWTRPFGPISGFDSKIRGDARLSYLMTTFSYGCQLGPSQTARALDLPRTEQTKDLHDRRHLGWVNQRHITVENLDRAIEQVIFAYEQFRLPRLWGSPEHVGADGTKWELYEENLLAEQHIRYGGYGGIGYYHVAGTYIALFANLIACGAWEGTYILDFFERYLSITQPSTLHADTQGQTEPLFGLTYLLNITLIPRIRNWQERKFYRPDARQTYQHIDRLFDATIDWKLIATHLPDMLRLVLSIRAGTLTPSTLVRILNSANHQNHIYRAFRELGRAVRTGMQLTFLGNADMRQTTQAAMNKNEAFNRFAKWAAFGNAGVLAENRREEQLKLIKYNQLVANCLIFYNTSVITTILHDLAQEGYPVKAEAVAALSPYLTRHIDRFGRYTLDLQRPTSPLVYDLPTVLAEAIPEPQSSEGQTPALAPL